MLANIINRNRLDLTSDYRQRERVPERQESYVRRVRALQLPLLRGEYQCGGR